MLKKITERVKKVSEGDFTNGSRAETPQENGISTPSEPHENALLIAIIILGIIVFALILIIIYGYYKYVREKREKMECERKERSSNMREPTGDSNGSSLSEMPPEVFSISVPVKMRKRSMTFSETDEECRKYRENLTDLSDKEETVENNERSRKKSVVTFVGVKEIDSNDSNDS